MKKILLILISSLLVTANANAESFSNALSKAYKNNSELNAERENIIISEQELKISQGNYLPTVTLSGSKSQEDTNKLLQKLYDEKTMKSSDNKKTAMPSDELEKLKASYMRKSFKYD